MIRRSLISILIVACAVSVSAGEAENVTVVERMISAVNDRNFDALDEVVAPNVVRHSAATPGVTVSSLDEFKAFLEADLAVCPDATQEVEAIFGSGDLVAVRARYMGTQTGAMGPFPATGKRMEIPFMAVLRIEGGKIAEMWVEWDNLNALVQLGHFPPKPSGE